MPLDELDIRIADTGSGEEFVRRLWWRATVPLPEDPLLHTLVAAYVTDVYMIDPALQVHGHSMRSAATAAAPPIRRCGSTVPVRADRWNLLECSSPAAARGRGVVTASLIGDDGKVAATLVQEGLIAEREPAPDSGALSRLSRIRCRISVTAGGEQDADRRSTRRRRAADGSPNSG